MDTPNFGNFDVIWLTLPNSFSLHLIQRDPGSNLPESPFNAGPDTEKDPNHIQRGHHISFGVSDYEDCVTTLKEKGIPIYEKTQQGGKIKQAFFFDPDVLTCRKWLGTWQLAKAPLRRDKSSSCKNCFALVDSAHIMVVADYYTEGLIVGLPVDTIELFIGWMERKYLV
eukprot:Gb_09633 [translate_table: standard]